MRSLTALDSKPKLEKQPSTPPLNLSFSAPPASPPSSPLLIADARSPVQGMETAWGGTCLFHGPNNRSRVLNSPLSHGHHAPILPPQQLPTPGTLVRGKLKLTGFRKQKAKQNPWQHEQFWGQQEDYSTNTSAIKGTRQA